jgi:N-formylglutamate amidohydrolase
MPTFSFPMRRLCLALLTLCLATLAPADDRRPELAPAGSLITAQRGEAPVIISAPHGGRVRIPGATERSKGVKVLDTNTAQLALLVSQRLTERLGRRPSLVVAHFSRKDADANRAPEPGPDDEAFASPAAKACYDAYHAALRACVDESKATFGTRVLLVDIHGQARMPEAIVRGTRQGSSMAHLVAEHGHDVIDGPRSIVGLLAAKGYVVEPPLRSQVASGEPVPDAPRRERFFAGGWITERYGAARDDGVNAIQLEFGRMRVDSLEKTARDAADAIAEFAVAFLGSTPPAPMNEREPEADPARERPEVGPLDAPAMPAAGFGT